MAIHGSNAGPLLRIGDDNFIPGLAEMNARIHGLDEATEGLAPLVRREIWACLKLLKAEGETILVIDKNLVEMESLVDRHHVVEKGRVVWQGTPAELAERPDVTQRCLGVA